MGKNPPLYQIIDELNEKYNLSPSERGKILVGAILETPKEYLLSKYWFASMSVQTKKKRQFISSLKRKTVDESVHQKYIGMSRENMRVLFDYRSIRDDRSSIEGLVSEILSNEEVFKDNESVFSTITALIYTGSKEYSLREDVKRKGLGSFKNKEYDAIVRCMRRFVDKLVGQS